MGEERSDTRLGEQDLAALGRQALAAHSLDLLAEWMIWAILGVEESVGKAVTERQIPTFRLARLKAIVRASKLDQELANEVLGFAGAAELAHKIRGENLHASWILLEESATRFRWKLMDSGEGTELHLEWAKVGPGQLAGIADEMEAVAERGRQLLERLEGRA